MCDAVRKDASGYCEECGHYYEEEWCDTCECSLHNCQCEPNKEVNSQDGCIHCGEPNCYSECLDNDNVATDDEDHGRYR